VDAENSRTTPGHKNVKDSTPEEPGQDASKYQEQQGAGTYEVVGYKRGLITPSERSQSNEHYTCEHYNFRNQHAKTSTAENGTRCCNVKG
jgi:hypothetical protein